MHNPLLDRFPGTIGFPVTPFTREGEFDANGFGINVEFLLGSGLSALAFCGSNGELQSITLDEYRAVAETASTMVAGKKGLLFGVGQTLKTAQEQARLARRAGADAVIIMAPYMADENEAGLADYYRLVAETAEIPAVLYQTKWSGVLPLSLLERLEDVENICMVKDENGNLSHYLNVRQRYGDRFFWVNGMAEPFVPSYWNLGITTFTSGLACFMPQVTDEIFERASAGDFGRVNQLLDEVVVPLYEIRNRKPGYKCSMIKTAMNLAGLAGGFVRSPLIELSAGDRSDLEGILAKAGLMNAQQVTA